MTKISDIEGIGPSYSEKLHGSGITTTEALLEAAAALKGRQNLAADTGISEKMILRWVNMADLFRIKGVGEEYADLLEAAGVDSVPELAQRNAENLHAKLNEVNASKKLVRQIPASTAVANWIDEAKTLPKLVSH